MFNVGEKIVYGNSGVFVVGDLTGSPVDKNDTRLFYVLRPMYGPEGNIICTPVDNDKVSMRQLISKEEAERLIERIPEIDLLTVVNEKQRRDVYKVSLANSGLDDYISIIKTVYNRRTESVKNKKRISETDAEYEKRAKFCLYSELSTVLGMAFEDVDCVVIDRIKEAI